jgi:hypothetical protein
MTAPRARSPPLVRIVAGQPAPAMSAADARSGLRAAIAKASTTQNAKTASRIAPCIEVCSLGRNGTLTSKNASNPFHRRENAGPKKSWSLKGRASSTEAWSATFTARAVTASSAASRAHSGRTSAGSNARAAIQRNRVCSSPPCSSRAQKVATRNAGKT